MVWSDVLLTVIVSLYPVCHVYCKALEMESSHQNLGLVGRTYHETRVLKKVNAVEITVAKIDEGALFCLFCIF